MHYNTSVLLQVEISIETDGRGVSVTKVGGKSRRLCRADSKVGFPEEFRHGLRPEIGVSPPANCCNSAQICLLLVLLIFTYKCDAHTKAGAIKPADHVAG